TDSSFIDLYDSDPGLFKRQNFITHRKSNLIGGNIPSLIIAYKRPLQNGYRTGKHAFHRLVRLRSGKGAPAYGHIPGAADVAINHRWFYPTAAVTLNPAVSGKQETV